MALDIKASRVMLFALAAIAIAVLAFYKQFSTRVLPVATAAETCAPIPANIKFLGPAMTIAQAEKLSLAEMAEAPPTVPRVPFGHLNSKWLELRQLSKTTDTVH